MSSVNSIGEINLSNKKLIKVVDALGRGAERVKNASIFYIYCVLQLNHV